MTSEQIETYWSIVKLPDGRFAVRNERDLSELTEKEVLAAAHALETWFPLALARAQSHEASG